MQIWKALLISKLYLWDEQNHGLQIRDIGVNYTALAKFMEQAFEWSVMDYTFFFIIGYPKHIGRIGIYQKIPIDPLFRSFLKAGMARVIVAAKPGFENAVQFFSL